MNLVSIKYGYQLEFYLRKLKYHPKKNLLLIYKHLSVIMKIIQFHMNKYKFI